MESLPAEYLCSSVEDLVSGHLFSLPNGWSAKDTFIIRRSQVQSNTAAPGLRQAGISRHAGASGGQNQKTFWRRTALYTLPTLVGTTRSAWRTGAKYLSLRYNELMTIPAPASQPEPLPPPTLTPEEMEARRARQRQMRGILIGAIVGVIVLVLILLGALFILLQPGVPTDRIRDSLIIIVAFETFVVGVALIVLLVQLATLINLLQNEVRPILQATTDTLNTLRGTTEFLSESVVEPVIKLNGYMASLQRVLELMGVKRR